MIQVDLTHMRHFIALPYEAALAPRLRIAHNHLQKSDGSGGEFPREIRSRPSARKICARSQSRRCPISTAPASSLP